MKRHEDEKDITNWCEMWMIEWFEHEAGWGNSPDGISLHKTLEDALEFEYENFLNAQYSLDYCFPQSIPMRVYVSPHFIDLSKDTIIFDRWSAPSSEHIYFCEVEKESEKIHGKAIFEYYRNHKSK